MEEEGTSKQAKKKKKMKKKNVRSLQYKKKIFESQGQTVTNQHKSQTSGDMQVEKKNDRDRYDSINF